MEIRQLSHSSMQILTALLAIAPLPILASSSNGWASNPLQAPLLPLLPRPPETGREHDFTLRHVFHHGTYRDPNLHLRLDVRPGEAGWTTLGDEDSWDKAGRFHIKSAPSNIQRLRDRRIETVDPVLSEARIKGKPPSLPASAWTVDEVNSPDIKDKETVLSLALAAANAYNSYPGEGDWEDVKHGWNYSTSFGWEEDGLRGHIFADDTNSTIILSLKGTSMAVFDGAETTTNDKENDNLFFSCCCGQGGHYLYRQVCDCQTSAFTCNDTCVIKALRQENRYYAASKELYGNVTELYPNSQVWIVGHSLGGSVGALLGLTYGIPTVTFQSVSDALAASRLGLPAPPGSHPYAAQSRQDTGVFHFGHTADPIHMGTCNAASSLCTFGGYALESQCHTGRICRYDTVEDKGWRVGIGTHSIRSVIKDVIRAYDDVPECVSDDECVDCFNWKYFKSNGSESTSSASSSVPTTSSTTLRTSTCKTPGWWGCLDETTTTTATTSTTSTTTSTTATCQTPGWFGCKDKVTTTTTVTTTAAPAPVITTTPPSTSTLATMPDLSPTFSSTTCETPGFFWGCKDKPTPISCSTHAITSGPIVASPLP